MGTIVCADCEGTVSDRCVSCPHCGSPTDAPQPELSPEAQGGVDTYVKVQARSQIFQALIRWSAIFGISMGITAVGLAMAGKATSADLQILIGFLGQIEVNQWAAWLFGGAGVTLGWRERVLRRATIKRLEGRIRYLERKVDPRRTSSDLTVTGETHPIDRL